MPIEQEYRDLLYLTACALNGISPHKERIRRMNLEKVFHAAEFQSMTALSCMALESAGISPEKIWKEAKEKAVRKVLLLTAEGRRICAEMERRGLKYLPLKGMLLAGLYPKIGMRQMSDCDILCESQGLREMQEFLLQSGYTKEPSPNLHHTEYIKKPVYHIELHQSLFQKDKALCAYYADPWRRCRRLPQTEYGYAFSDTDGYVYLVAHAGRHFRGSGTGLRFLTDLAVTLRQRQVDIERAERELEKLGLAEFERHARGLALRLFEPPCGEPENAEQEKLLSLLCRAGSYGTETIRMEQRWEKMHAASKAEYLWRRLFPDMEFYETYLPFFARHKLLLPAAWGYRLVHGMTVGRARLKKELRAVQNRKEPPGRGGDGI